MSSIPLIEIKEGDKVILNEEACNILSSLTSPISVIATAGTYRSGKSSLLNFLMGSASFGVGCTTERCTRGIWMSRPVKGMLETGEECDVVFLDTEGIGGIDVDAKYDARIFSLAILLSSTLLFNSMGNLDEKALSNISFISQIAEHIHVSADTNTKMNKVIHIIQ